MISRLQLILCMQLTLLVRVFAQGPPILLDKPIMLGANKGTVRTLYKNQELKVYDFSTCMLEADYNVSNFVALGTEIPINFFQNSIVVGDLNLMAKVQFYNYNRIGKTVRLAAKAKQMFATGKKLETMTLGMGHAMSYLGLLAARESLKLGTQAELGYYFSPSASHLNFLSAKLGFGIPLLKPVYPVNQVNLYFESEGIFAQNHLGKKQYGIYLAPGIQYAKKIFTVEASFQFPLGQQFHHLATYERRSSLLIGGRVII